MFLDHSSQNRKPEKYLKRSSIDFSTSPVSGNWGTITKQQSSADNFMYQLGKSVSSPSSAIVTPSFTMPMKSSKEPSAIGAKGREKKSLAVICEQENS